MGKALRVLIIEDSEDDAQLLLRELQRAGYEPSFERVDTAAAMREALDKHSWDIIIADYIMPRFSGLAALALLKEKDLDVPFIVVSGKIGEDTAVEAMKAGAHDYIVKGSLGLLVPAVERELREVVVRQGRKRAEEELNQAYAELEKRVDDRTAELARANRELQQARDKLEMRIQERTAELANANEQLHIDIAERRLAQAALKKSEEELKQSVAKLQMRMEETIHAIGRIVEMRDPYTSGHQRRVAKLAKSIAEEMGLPKDQIDAIEMAANIHDVGKIHVPAELLSKPGRLTEAEFRLIKVHAQVGYDILKAIEFPWPIAEITLQHHERIDGSGYPFGLKGEEILLEARILGVADVVEAMASHRPYRPAKGLDAALDEISGNSGLLYDADVANASKKVFARVGLWDIW